MHEDSIGGTYTYLYGGVRHGTLAGKRRYIGVLALLGLRAFKLLLAELRSIFQLRSSKIRENM